TSCASTACPTSPRCRACPSWRRVHVCSSRSAASIRCSWSSMHASRRHRWRKRRRSMLRLRKVHRSADTETSVDVSEVDGVRNLHIGNATVQSAMRLRAPFELELRYTRGMMTYMLFNTEVKDVLVLGLGGG